MTLKDFESQIAETILERGLDYYTNEQVDDLENTGSGNWMASVHGSDMYDVYVKTNRTQIKDWDCDCPYDHGSICKHVVAVLYAIKSEKEIVSNAKGEKKTKSKDRAKELLQKITRKELEEFILFSFKKDKKLKNEFVAYFIDQLEEDPYQKNLTLLRNLYKAAQDRYSFVNYSATRKLCKAYFELAKKAEKKLASNNVTESLAICKAIIEEIPVYIQNMDDSSGDPSDLYDYTFDVFF